LFQDQSFEVIIRDDTKTTKRKILKHQITENIAHELKTPVSSIKGFLETVIDNKVDRGKMMEFIRRAYSQTCRLTDLINDLSLLTKIEEAGNLYPIESVNILNTIEAVIEDLQGNIDENGITIRNSVTENIEINGNQVLIYSIFRNLVENTVNHAGKGVTIMIDKYLEDSSHYYFSYSDTGTGVPQSDLPRLFERFYRVDKGRDRKSGGTGLGLSIVKNAIQFHKGEISAKNRKDGGLEFLFTLSRDTGI
jgi:signal transduction histidine kinase